MRENRAMEAALNRKETMKIKRMTVKSRGLLLIRTMLKMMMSLKGAKMNRLMIIISRVVS